MKNKLLNFTICQIVVVIGMLTACVKCQEQKMPATENVTIFDRSFEKVLSRRKRFLVWRPGSNLLLTGSLVKPLAFPRPGGHNVILEWDIFYPLPDSWRKPKKPTPAPVPVETTTPEVVEHWDPHLDPHSGHPGEIWMPSGGWDSDVIKTLSDGDDKPADKRNWNIRRQQQLRRNDWNGNNLFNSPSSSQVTQYQNPLLYNQPWQQSPHTNPHSRNKKINFNQRYYQSNRQPPPPSSFSERNFIASRKQRQVNFAPKGRSLELRDGEKATQMGVNKSTDEDWEHHFAHRDRRDLYERIESASSLLSFDIKSCLLRAMCEAQHFLHPPGYSLLQDMLRVVFTIPIKDGMADDYSIAMQANDQDCVSVYSKKCPMSILAFLLRSKF